MLKLRQLAGVTVGLTFLLILLGVYTAATGAGLGCSAQWPLCDDGVLPQSLPSVIEWTHRFVAMVTGFFIIGTAVQAWRTTDSTRIQYAATSAVVLLPVQVLLGANTVFNYGALSQVAHQAAAQLIFAGVLATWLWARSRESSAKAPQRTATDNSPS